MRLVYENEEFVVFAPWASKGPFETWIVPKRHESNFEAEPKERLGYCAQALRHHAAKLGRRSGTRPTTSSSTRTRCATRRRRTFHWHIELMPALTNVAGFEWGTRLLHQPVPPEEAAEFLRTVAL